MAQDYSPLGLFVNVSNLAHCILPTKGSEMVRMFAKSLESDNSPFYLFITLCTIL